MRTLLYMVTILSAAAMAQPARQPEPGARELFFAGAAPKDDLPPVHQAAAKPAAAATPNPAAALRTIHLGIRYNVLLVKSHGDRGVPVAADGSFHKGDCVAVELAANRSGYLYVLSKQSSGDWIPLFPTPELADQSNRIDPGQVVRTPKRDCFEIDDPPGTETLFIVLSRDPRDIFELSDSIQGRPGDKPQPAGATEMASAGKINSAVNQMAVEYGTRDLPFRQVVRPGALAAPPHKSADKAELENAVYVVNGSGKPAATLVTKLEIRHD